MQSVLRVTFLIVACSVSLNVALDQFYQRAQFDYGQAAATQAEQDYYAQYYRSLYDSQPQQSPTESSIPVQPLDSTYYRDFYGGEALPYRPSEYASHNYFNQPGSAAEQNYFISPVELHGFGLDGALDALLPESHDNHIF